MTTLAKINMLPDKSLKKVFKAMELWMAHPEAGGELENYLEKLHTELHAPLLTRSVCLHLDRPGMVYGNAACAAFGRGDGAELPRLLRWAVAFRSLGFRAGARDLPNPDRDLGPAVLLPAFQTSLKAAGPGMLGQWEETALNARALIAYAEAEQRRNGYPGSARDEGWGKGTHDAFLIFLLAEVFGLSTTYTPAKPLIPAYRRLLDDWRSPDAAAFRDAMAPAIAFHLERSKHNGKWVNYEFSYAFDRAFPTELLILQALRRREGLPEFETGHPLVDAPWAAIRELPEAEPHPLLIEALARLRADDPQFR